MANTDPTKQKKVKKLSKAEQKFSVPVAVLQAMLDYLSKQPYDQVVNLISTIQQQSQEIK